LVHLTLPPSTPAGYGPGPDTSGEAFSAPNSNLDLKGLLLKKEAGSRDIGEGEGKGREEDGREGEKRDPPIFLTNVTLIGIIIMLGDEYSPPFNSLYYETLMAVTV